MYFDRGHIFFHLENWYSVHPLLRINDLMLTTLTLALDGYTLLHLSDLHLDMSESHLARLIERVQGLHYDLCVVTGDFRFRTSGALRTGARSIWEDH